MHTTYILHGGDTSRDTPENEAFFALFTSLVAKDNVKILMCYWARDRKEWEHLLERDSQKILQQTSKKVEFTLTNDVNDLYQKIQTHHVLYVAGGDAEPLEKLLPQLTQLKGGLDNKVYIGSSMGAFIASRYYVLSGDSQNDDSVRRGLNLLPISTLCHWNIEPKQQEKKALLAEVDLNTPIITLNECQFRKFEE